MNDKIRLKRRREVLNKNAVHNSCMDINKFAKNANPNDQMLQALVAEIDAKDNNLELPFEDNNIFHSMPLVRHREDDLINL